MLGVDGENCAINCAIGWSESVDGKKIRSDEDAEDKRIGNWGGFRQKFKWFYKNASLWDASPQLGGLGRSPEKF